MPADTPLSFQIVWMDQPDRMDGPGNPGLFRPPLDGRGGRGSVPLAVQILRRERTLTLDIHDASVFAGESTHLCPGGHSHERARWELLRGLTGQRVAVRHIAHPRMDRDQLGATVRVGPTRPGRRQLEADDEVTCLGRISVQDGDPSFRVSLDRLPAQCFRGHGFDGLRLGSLPLQGVRQDVMRQTATTGDQKVRISTFLHRVKSGSASSVQHGSGGRKRSDTRHVPIETRS